MRIVGQAMSRSYSIRDVILHRRPGLRQCSDLFAHATFAVRMREATALDGMNCSLHLAPTSPETFDVIDEGFILEQLWLRPVEVLQHGVAGSAIS
jgi:hypothetical protein